MSLEVKDLSFGYDERIVLNNMSLTAHSGEVLSILGPNGVGKSTLFKCILGLLPNYTGRVTVNGFNASDLSVRELARQIAYVPQRSEPVYNFSVQEIVLMGTTNALGLFSSPGKTALAKVDKALERLGISELSRRCFHHTSGGERQLIMIARALVQEAPILLLDEPTANLDRGNQIMVLNQIKALAKDGYTVVQTTHDPEHSYMFSDRILTMKNGAVLSCSSPRNILNKETMKLLYEVDMEVSSLFDDKARFCVPSSVISEVISDES